VRTDWASAPVPIIIKDLNQSLTSADGIILFRQPITTAKFER
jgi:hypothetical protein